MGPLLFLIYRCLYPLLRWTATYILAPLNDKIRQGVFLRKTTTLPQLTQNYNKKFWFHCSSGEFEYAKPIIARIKEDNPDSIIIVTYFSPSYKETIEGSAEVDFALPLPWDQPPCIKQFLQQINPSCLIISKTDLWPELIYQVHKKQTPLYLIAGNFHSHSHFSGFLIRPFYRFLLKRFNHISCISQEDQNLLKKISPQISSSVDGDPRYEQVFARLQVPHLLKASLKEYLIKEKTVVFGSTWPQDDREILKTISILKSQDGDFTYIIVPHELNDSKRSQLSTALNEHGLEVRLYSQADSWKPGEVLLVDQKGILAQLYTWGAFAFVGGSFRKTVHSVMEPLAAGCITFVGPYHHNNREAVAFKKTSINGLPLPPVCEVHNGSDMANKILTTSKSLKGATQKTSEKITQKVKVHLGASYKILEHLLKERK